MLLAPVFKCVIFIVAFIYFLSQVYPPLFLFATLRLMLPSHLSIYLFISLSVNIIQITRHGLKY